MIKKNWTGFEVGKYGVKGVPKNASCLFGWGKGKGHVTVESHFLLGQEDLFAEELARLRGHEDNALFFAENFGYNGFHIIAETSDLLNRREEE